jgi:hypothetical protein
MTNNCPGGVWIQSAILIEKGPEWIQSAIFIEKGPEHAACL